MKDIWVHYDHWRLKTLLYNAMFRSLMRFFSLNEYRQKTLIGQWDEEIFVPNDSFTKYVKDEYQKNI